MSVGEVTLLINAIVLEIVGEAALARNVLEVPGAAEAAGLADTGQRRLVLHPLRLFSFVPLELLQEVGALEDFIGPLD